MSIAFANAFYSFQYKALLFIPHYKVTTSIFLSYIVPLQAPVNSFFVFAKILLCLFIFF